MGPYQYEPMAWEHELLDLEHKQRDLANKQRMASIALLNLYKVSDHLSARQVTDMLRQINDLPA